MRTVIAQTISLGLVSREHTESPCHPHQRYLLTDKELSFIEFKTNVSSDLDKTILEHAEKAVDQLWHTYDGIINTECQKTGVDVKQKVSIDFYVVFDNRLSVTGVRADFQNLQNEFLQDKYYPLFFQNNKQFE